MAGFKVGHVTGLKAYNSSICIGFFASINLLGNDLSYLSFFICGNKGNRGGCFA